MSLLKKVPDKLFNRVALALLSARFAIAVLAVAAVAVLGVPRGGASAATLYSSGDAPPHTYWPSASTTGLNIPVTPGQTYHFSVYADSVSPAGGWLGTNNGTIQVGTTAVGWSDVTFVPQSGQTVIVSYSICFDYYCNNNAYTQHIGMIDDSGHGLFRIADAGGFSPPPFAVAASHSPAAPDLLTPTSFGGTFTATGAMAGSARVLLDGNVVKECTYAPAVASGSCLTDPAALPVGSHTVTLRVSGDGFATWNDGTETFTVTELMIRQMGAPPAMVDTGFASYSFAPWPSGSTITRLELPIYNSYYPPGQPVTVLIYNQGGQVAQASVPMAASAGSTFTAAFDFPNGLAMGGINRMVLARNGFYCLYDCFFFGGTFAEQREGGTVGNRTATAYYRLYGHGLAPLVFELTQKAADGVALIAPGATAPGQEVLLGAKPESASGALVRVRFQILPASVAFTTDWNVGIVRSSGLVASGTPATVASGPLAPGEWHWRAKAIDGDGLESAGVQMNQGATTPDFTVPGLIHTVPVAYGVDRATPVAPGGALHDGWAWFQATLSGAAGTSKYLAVRLTDLTTNTITVLSSDPVSLGIDPSTVTGVYSAHLDDNDFAWDYQIVTAGSVTDPGAWIHARDRNSCAKDFSVQFGKTMRVAVVMARPNDVNPATTVSAWPCKIDPKTPVSYGGHSRQYYLDMKECFENYIRQNTYGKIDADVNILMPSESDGWFSNGLGNKQLYLPSGKPLQELNLDQFVEDVITVTHVSKNDYDALMVVMAGYENRALTGKSSFGPTMLISEDDPLGAWSHEMGHVLGYFLTPYATLTPDLYDDARTRWVWNWDVMGSGGWNGFSSDFTVTSYGFSEGWNPAPFGTVSRQYLGFLGEQSYDKSYRGLIPLKYLNDSSYGDKIARINLRGGSAGDPVNRYYLLEARKRGTVDDWFQSMPGNSESNLVMYYVDEKGADKYGYDEHGQPFNKPIFTTILGNDKSSGINRSIIDPSSPFWFADPINHIVVTASLPSNGANVINADIETLDSSAFQYPIIGMRLIKEMKVVDSVDWGMKKMNAAIDEVPLGMMKGTSDDSPGIFEQLDEIVGRIIACFMLMTILSLPLVALAIVGRKTRKGKNHKYTTWLIGITLALFALAACYLVVLMMRYGDLNAREQTSLLKRQNRRSVPFGIKYAPTQVLSSVSLSPDLHLWCDDGRHVGLDYATGQFENDFPDALVSGPMGGAPEWIYVPATVTGCRYSVSSYQEQQWLAANPDLAAQIVDKTDTYELSAGAIDPALGIFESATIAGTIAPGQDVNYDLTGSGASIGVTAGAVAPRTDATLAGERDAATGEFIGPVTVTLSSEPGAVTSYSLSGGASWTGYAGPFAVATPGATLLQYRSVGADGSQELTKSLNISIVSPDAVAPVLSVASPLDGYLTASSSVTITGTAPDAGSGLMSVTAGGAPCALDGDAFVCAGVPLAEGPNEIVVVAADAAGNAATVTLHVSRDSVAPETSVDSAPTGWTGSTEAVVAFSADEPGSTFLCSLDGATPSPCLSPATLPGLADGAHAFSVAATDPAGNADSRPAVAEWSVDATAPSASVSSPTSGLLTGSPSVDVTVAVSDAGSGVATVAVGEAACATSTPGLWLCAAVPLAEGENEVAVNVTDIAGNSATASVTITSDTVAPAASGAAVSLASGSVSAAVSLSDASDVASAVATVRGPQPSSVSVLSFALVLDTATGAWSASATLLPQSTMPDGRYEVVIGATDAAGNAAAFAAGSFSLDRSSPEAPDVSVAPSVARPGVPVAVSVFAADASSGVASVSVRDAATGSVVSLALATGDAASGTWTGEIIAALPEGEHAITVTVTDAEGNATAASAAFYVDATAPSIALTSAPPALSNSAVASVEFSSGDATASFLCRLDGAETVACVRPFAVAALSDGLHSVAVAATDPAGNASAAASANWTVDTAAPDTAVLSGPAAASLTRSASFDLSMTEPGSSFLCSLDGAAAVPCASPYSLVTLADGPHLLSVTATDPAGNADATPAEWRWSVAAPVCPVLAISGTFSFTCAENADGSTLVSIVGDKWRQAFAVFLPFGASPAAPRATVAVTADDHNRNKPALSFLTSLPSAIHATLTVPRGHASATYACVGAASLEIGPGCSGTRVIIPAPGQFATFAAGRAISTSADGASVTVTGF